MAAKKTKTKSARKPAAKKAPKVANKRGAKRLAKKASKRPKRGLILSGSSAFHVDAFQVVRRPRLRADSNPADDMGEDDWSDNPPPGAKKKK